jgi:PAS domain S-box-containing protein
MKELGQNNRKLIPASIIIISIAVIVLNFLFISLNHTLIFDPLFYVPIIFTAYYYPERGVFFAVGTTMLYLAMVLAEFHQSIDILITGLGHACFFIIVGCALTYFSLWSPHELKIYKQLGDNIEPGRIKTIIIPACIVILSATIFFLNFLVLLKSDSVIFDPLFYFPIILVAYFYPRKTVVTTAAITSLYLAMVMVVPRQSTEVVTTSIGHAGLFIIIGFVDAYLSMNLSKVPAIHKHFAEIVESSSDAISGITLDGIITDWNNGAERLYGYTAGEVTGKSVSLLVPPDRTDEIYLILNRIQWEESITGYEIEQVTKEGVQIFVSLSGSLIKNDSGRVIGISTIAHDITERKRIEEALRERERKYRELIESLPQTVFETDERGTLTSANHILFESFGYSQEDFEKGLNIIDMVAPEDRDLARHNILRVFNGEKLAGIDYTVIRKDGSTFPVIMYTDVIFRENKPAGMRGVVLDISERRQAEEEMLHKNEELRVAFEALNSTKKELWDNYHDLVVSQKALEVARKKLNILNTLTFQDIQNAIFSLTAYFDLIKNASDDETVQSYLEKEELISHNITESLQFAKNYQDMGLHPPIWQNVAQTFLYAQSHLDFSTISRKVKLDKLEIYADPLLETVFFHLLKNITRRRIRATELILHYEEAPDGLVLVIEDNGVGIPVQEKEKIFDYRYGMDNGFGLFLVREILTNTGITIRETGEPGKGARFEMLVPKGMWRIAKNGA